MNEYLSDEILGEILSYCDYTSAVKWCHIVQSTSKLSSSSSSSSSFSSRTLSQLWRLMYERHQFAPVEKKSTNKKKEGGNATKRMVDTVVSSSESITTTTIDYQFEIHHRRQLLFNLLQQQEQQQRHKRLRKQGLYNPCSNLPNRYFFFKPIIPKELMQLRNGGSGRGRGKGQGLSRGITIGGLVDDDDYNDNDDNSDDDNDDDDDDVFLDHAPPVFYECDSFVLSSPGTSGECIFLDPFDGRLSVIKDIVSHCIASDEAMMEQAMVKAANAISTIPRSCCYGDWMEDEIAGHCFEESVYLNHTRHEYPPPPCQELLKADESFFLDVAPYFPTMRNHPHHHHREGMTLHNTITAHEDEFDMSYVGTDAKPILDPCNEYKSIQGYMVGVGRSIMNLSVRNMVCTELTLWTRHVGDDQYDVDHSKMVCRFPYTFSIVDFEPLYKRLFVSFLEGEGPSSSSSAIAPSAANSKNSIIVYPMIAWRRDDDDDDEDCEESSHNKYFPQPLGTIVCCSAVSSMTVDCTGLLLLVGCERSLEVWDTPPSYISSSSFRRLQVLNVTRSLRTSINHFIKRVRNTRSKQYVTEMICNHGSEFFRAGVPSSSELSTCISGVQTSTLVSDDDGLSPQRTTTASSMNGEPDGADSNNNNGSNSIINDDNNDDKEVEEISFRVLKHLPALAQFRSPIDSILIPKHLPAKEGGFVTLQYDRKEGTSLLLWRRHHLIATTTTAATNTPGTSKDETTTELTTAFRVVSIINLSWCLSARRKPRVSYDGNRMIVFGEDHIGMIILIYQMSNGDIQFHDDDEEDEDNGENTTTTENTKIRDHCGGVYNLTTPPQVRFANRIRHAALDGIDRLDSIHLTANERFIIVNTKSGHLLGRSSNGSNSPSSSSCPYSEGLLVIDLEERTMVRTMPRSHFMFVRIQ
jgi:hypothetical protein